MPAFTVTAVDTTANTLTATGVAAVGQPEGTVLITGDRLRLRNVGGALPAATPALAGVTDYYAVRVSDDAVKLSDTNAHALAGTNIIDITGTGSGTTTIEFGLPYCLPTATAVAGTQIKSVNDRTAWNSLVALYELLTGHVQTIWAVADRTAPIELHALSGVVHSGWAPITLSADFDASLGSTAAGYFILPVPTLAGDTIRSVDFQLIGNGTADITVTAHFLDASMADTAIGSLTVNNQAASWSVKSFNVTPTPIVANSSLLLSFSANATGLQVATVNVWRSRPPL